LRPHTRAGQYKFFLLVDAAGEEAAIDGHR
jgi:hypothetical protein